MAVVYFMSIIVSLCFFIKRKNQRRYIIILLAGSILAFFMRIAELSKTDSQSVTEIIRSEKDGRNKIVELQVKALERKSDNTEAKEADIGETGLILEIEKQAYTKEELEVLEQEMWREVEKRLPGKNSSLDDVTEPLCFPERVEGYPFCLTWSSSQPDILAQDGSLKENIPEQGVLIEVNACITEEGYGFEKDRLFYVKVFPSQTWEAYFKRLQLYLKESEALSRKEGYYLLPKDFEGKRLLFRERKKENSKSLFLLAVTGAVAMAAVIQQEQKKKDKQRMEEIEKAYPQLAVRMAMLADTGLTISGALKRIVGEYGKRKQKKALPLYEELLVACREMESGISEKTAYQNLAKRCSLTCIIRFSALLVQYVQSGAAGLKKALKEEAGQALKERKERARRKGEEAGTKLLLPMMLMLVLVMVIIMIPAFTSFGI